MAMSAGRCRAPPAVPDVHMCQRSDRMRSRIQTCAAKIYPTQTGDMCCCVMLQVIEEDLGLPWTAIFSSLSPCPVAAASLGQVYRGRLVSNGAEVAVKVGCGVCCLFPVGGVGILPLV